MKAFTKEDYNDVISALSVLTDQEKEALYHACTYESVFSDEKQRQQHVHDSMQFALNHPSTESESALHAAFLSLYDFSRRHKSFSDAEVVARTYLMISERLPDNPRDIAIAYRMVGEMHLYQKDLPPDNFIEPCALLKKSLELWELMDFEDPGVKAGWAITASSYALALEERGEFIAAEKLLINARDVFRDLTDREFDGRMPWYAGSLMNLSELYINMGKQKIALECLRTAISILLDCPADERGYVRLALNHATKQLQLLENTLSL